MSRPGVELLPSGDERGLDPRGLTTAELVALGHGPVTLRNAVKAHCAECCGGSTHEARICTAVSCNLGPFRTGINPWKAPIPEERLEAMRESGKALGARWGKNINASSSGAASRLGETGRTEGAATTLPENTSRTPKQATARVSA